MTTRHLDIIDRSVEQANVWINELAEEFGTEDRREAYRILRAFLHAIRDRITVEESAQLAAQLPELIRGIFYEGWRPGTTPQRYRDRTTFLRKVAEEALLAGPTEASYAVTAAAAVLSRHVSAGEIADVRGILPAEIRELLESESAAGGDDRSPR
jgi:uncharacterized protein (DUF2267 family)